MPDPEENHLVILKDRIDTSFGTLDFSQGLKKLGNPPTDETYRAGTRYAHVRYLNCCEYVNWLYDNIRKMWRQTLLNNAKADGSALRMAALEGAKIERISGLPRLRIGDETWIQKARKGVLQQEILRAVEARRKLDLERDSLLALSEEAAKAERASR